MRSLNSQLQQKHDVIHKKYLELREKNDMTIVENGTLT